MSDSNTAIVSLPETTEHGRTFKVKVNEICFFRVAEFCIWSQLKPGFHFPAMRRQCRKAVEQQVWTLAKCIAQRIEAIIKV